MLQCANFVLHDLSAAEDAVQEAFVTAWRQSRTIPSESRWDLVTSCTSQIGAATGSTCWNFRTASSLPPPA